MPFRMTDDRQRVASDFDIRAANYSRNVWHRVCAEGLIAHAPLRAGARVLDAGVGTGFAAIAAAKKVGSSGHVVGVDISSGMLQQARAAVDSARLTNVELRLGDASDLRELPSGTFDAVVCAAALLYMPVPRALAEWHRLLKPGGSASFSSMRMGHPKAGQLFRDCAAEFGVQLVDPSGELGSEAAASSALRHAGYTEIRVVADRVHLSDADFALAWESNLRSAAHGEVRSLVPAVLDALRSRFEQALRLSREADAAFGVADVLYAYGTKPENGNR